MTGSSKMVLFLMGAGISLESAQGSDIIEREDNVQIIDRIQQDLLTDDIDLINGGCNNGGCGNGGCGNGSCR